ncbi:hypothetical protein NE865_09455 [Phthorimaea operculella]|nr:hypothetical protein NE865_09455 [Phthorimaea operculella]
MPKYVVTYFNVRGLGEPSRLLLSYGGQEFEDRRIEREEWEKVKPKAAAAIQEQDPELKKKKHEENIKNNGWMLEKLNDIIVKNNGHLACGKLTWADFVFAGIYDALKFMMQSPDLDSKFPAFKQLQEAVYSLPGVKEFAAKAPKTDL